jgi:endonuclease III related protein
MTDAKFDQIRGYYHTLLSAWGRQHWWPAHSRFEVIVGAYLTQNTSWSNVERALGSLRQARRLSIDGIRRTPLPALEKLIRSAGYFRQKAQRLKTFVRFLDRRYGGSLTRMFAQPTAKLREELLALNGVGPETADSILLYAGNHPVFVVDAYTRRILERHEIISPRAGYDEIRELFERALPDVVPTPRPLSREPALSLSKGRLALGVADNEPQRTEAGAATPAATAPRGSSHPPSAMSEAGRTQLVQVFNEMHGLLVGVGKNYCLKSQMRCEQCPLQKFLPEKS